VKVKKYAVGQQQRDALDDPLRAEYDATGRAESRRR
jgi:hypothetical protein